MSSCLNCGAADDNVSVVCRFCKTPYSEEISREAIRCPGCGAPNRGGRTACAACKASLLIACVFCGHGTAQPASACSHCGEGFAGAAERKSARETEKLLGAAANVLGAIAGVAVASSGRSGGGWTGGSGGDDGAPPMES